MSETLSNKVIPNAAKQQVVNVASVPHRSPFRYPGGKTWLVPLVRAWLKSLPAKPAEFGEPFAGGGIVALSVIFEDLAGHATLVELDADVGAVWQTLFNGDGPLLAERITSFALSAEVVRAVLAANPGSLLDRAFATILRNRVQRGGIMARGATLMKKGENGKGLSSRWYPQTLARRILDIHRQRQRLSFILSDGIAFIREHAARKDMAFFIDPPYTVAGRRLYTHSDIDHRDLFAAAATIQGSFLMSYDNAEPVRELARAFGFDTQTVAMKNTHNAVMSELLIGRDLTWCR
jgi:DNA adenine methylase